MHHEAEMAKIAASKQENIVAAGEKQFKVETAAKMLPKLGADHEIETYLVTFEKIATINKWPKAHWTAVLQTQLKGKTLRVFSELSDNDCKDFEKLKKALLAAFELSPEVYRKRFRSQSKGENDSYLGFAFKLNSM